MALVPSEFDQSTEFVRPMTAGRRTDIKNHTLNNPFIAPSDGYVALKANGNGTTAMSMGGAFLGLSAPTNTWNVTFVKKNTDMWVASTSLANCEYAFFIMLS